MKKQVTALAVALCASLCMGGCSLPDKVQSILPDKLEQTVIKITEKIDPDVVKDKNESSGFSGSDIFKVGNMKCSQEDARIILLSYQNKYSSIYGVDLWNHDYGDGPNLEDYVRDLTLSQLADVYTLNVIAGVENVTLTSAEKEDAAAAAEEFWAGLSDSEKAYAASSEKAVAALYEKYVLAQKIYGELTKNVDAEVSDDEARVQELMQIYMSDYTAAQQVKQMLDDGSSFSSLSSSYNEAEDNVIYASRQDFSQEVADVLFSLVEGEYSDIIQVDNGYYMYQCVTYYDKERTDAHKDAVTQEHIDAYMSTIYDQYGSAVNSVLNENAWNSVEVDKRLTLSGTTFTSIYDKYF